MKEKFAEALVNILKIKSIVTIMTTTAFIVLSLRGDIEAGQFLTIFTVIIGFYFGSQKIKENEGEMADAFKTAKSAGYFATPDIEYDAVYTANGDDK